ncbi:MAG: DNA-processing protein DprA, partial [Firmicutes bacterium]|nr:DNA-processing protein DprA [Bacillota bacterium]
MKNLIYDVWLSTLPGVTSARKLELMRRFGGPAGVFQTPEAELKEMFSKNNILSTSEGGLHRLLQKDLRRAEWCLKQAKKTGAAVVSIRCASYPPQLKTIKDPPIVLFALGDVSLLQTRCIAVVGTRRASPYGKWAAAEIAKRVTLAGVTVVS